MGKLRVIQERKNDSSEVADLRGFGDSDLFQKSGIETHLHVSAIGTDSEFLQTICNAYGLKTESQGTNAILHVEASRVGEHKIEALKLFVASLEIAEKAPHAHCLIYQTSGMHRILHQKITQKPKQDHKAVDQLLKEGLTSKTTISLHAPVAEWVHQAGLIPKPASQTWSHLTNSDIAHAHQQLSHKAEESHASENVVSMNLKRKAG